jgi:hypothetical protein
MDDIEKNHSVGKKGESETWPFLEKKGYIRPSNRQRKQIKEFYEKKGITIETRGFDVLSFNEISLIGKKAITLYEVKTTGRKRGEFVGENFIGLGFTLSGKEKNNADKLKSKYKFIFVNLYKETYKIYTLKDFFNSNIANIYQTWSIFITKGLK